MYKGLFLFLSMLLIACGADEEAAFEISDKALVVSLSKVAQEIEDNGLKVTFKVVSDSSPKTDVLVNVRQIDYSFESRLAGLQIGCDYNPREIWVTIPKGKRESQDIEETYDAPSLNGCTRVEILPLPIIDVVGEGEVINQEELQGYYGGRETIEGKEIPKDFVFPYYKVENPDGITLYCPKPAKILSIDPPSGSIIPWEFYIDEGITITFDTPPECPKVSFSFRDTFLSGSGKTFSISIGLGFISLNSVVEGHATIGWGSGDSETSEKFIYTVRRGNF